MKSPAFQFYPTDYLASQRVQMMTLEEEGAYCRLLCYCWQHGSIPSDPELAARLVGKGCSTTVARRVLAMFEIACGDGRVAHDRLDRERAKQAEWREKSSAGGKKSAQMRQESKGGSTVVQPPCQPNGNIPVSSFQSPSSTSSLKEEEKGANAPSRFQKPTLEALKLAMAKAGGTDTDAESFLNHYEANGWKVGRNPMKSWPHAVGNWIARKREIGLGTGGTTGTGQKLNGGPSRPLYVGELKAVLEAQRGKRAQIERRGYEDAFGIQFSKPEDRAEWAGVNREIRETLDKISKAGQ